MRRNIFTAALVRRVVHVVAGREEKDKCGGCLETVEKDLCRSFTVWWRRLGRGWPAGYWKCSRRRRTCSRGT